MKIRIGLDEAGRGCVLGSLFVGAVAFESHTDDVYFNDLGVKDSKKLSAEKRELLFTKIKKHCLYRCSFLTPQEIDAGNLNSLEFSCMSMLANEIIESYLSICIRPPEFEIFIDCPTQDSHKHKQEFRNSLPHSCNIEVVSEHKADDKYIVVGASSIVAKVLRDNAMDEIKRTYAEYGDIGSGYPSDWKTKQFLEQYYAKHKDFPIETRLKWGTVEKIRRENSEDTKPDRKGLSDDTEDG